MLKIEFDEFNLLFSTFFLNTTVFVQLFTQTQFIQTLDHSLALGASGCRLAAAYRKIDRSRAGGESGVPVGPSSSLL